MKECKYKDITIPVGCSAVFNSLLLHKDPQYWEYPEKFDPLRYTPCGLEGWGYRHALVL
jgi:cytochrome P450